MRRLLCLAVLALLMSCSGIISKREAGLCSRMACANEIHEPDAFCGGCGNCELHCISAPFEGPNP